MDKINIDQQPETNVDWFADGERANATVLNRPIKQIASKVNELVDELDLKLDSNLVGVPNGVAELDSSGKVPSSQLPSYVDDVLEYSDFASFPVTGETGKIYIDLSTNNIYRWSGSTYIQISNSAGTADSALRLDTARTISLTGDVTGSTSFDGSANVSITAVVADDSHNHIISNVDGLQAELDGKATAAQGAKADTALQPNTDITVTNINVTGTVDGRDVSVDGSKLDTIESGADVTDSTNVVSALQNATLVNLGTPAVDDKILIQDSSDSNSLKYVLASSISGSDLPSLAGNASLALVVNAAEDGVEWGRAVQNFYTEFTTSGTFTKDPKSTYVYVECVGGGGSGGISSGSNVAYGGCGGMFASRIFRAEDLPASVTVTVGAGGDSLTFNATAGGISGNNGGDSTFGTFLTGYGGQGGPFLSFPFYDSTNDIIYAPVPGKAAAYMTIGLATSANARAAAYASSPFSTGSGTPILGHFGEVQGFPGSNLQIQNSLFLSDIVKNTIYGGGGGGSYRGTSDLDYDVNGGTSENHGDGGQGGRVQNGVRIRSASNGSFPGGAGGADGLFGTPSILMTSGAGADGVVRIWQW